MGQARARGEVGGYEKEKYPVFPLRPHFTEISIILTSHELKFRERG